MLAQRSAGAAREIKSLIEESVSRVEQGSRLVADAGATMNRIVDSVRETGVLIGEISRAAQEQSAGVGQVNESVGELDGMTQQNAALVEQSAAAAMSLKDQAERLASAVNQFELARG
jgi:methyl-accepting chemotaxis protein